MEYWNVVNYIDGANADDGLINPDRVPQPEIHEAKRVMQNIQLKSSDPKGGEFKLLTGISSVIWTMWPYTGKLRGRNSCTIRKNHGFKRTSSGFCKDQPSFDGSFKETGHDYLNQLSKKI